jgi:type IV pilus assembly protein PilN
MARINLLPWRESQRKKREKIFYLALALSVAMTANIISYINLYISDLVENQKQRNKYLQEQITILDKQINKIKDLEKEKEKLLGRMEIIQKLQTSRPQIVRIFDKIAQTIPSGIYLESIKRQGHISVLNGVAESNARVSIFMRNLDASLVFQDLKLEVIEKTGKNQGIVRKFTLLLDENQSLTMSSKGGMEALR